MPYENTIPFGDIGMPDWEFSPCGSIPLCSTHCKNRKNLMTMNRMNQEKSNEGVADLCDVADAMMDGTLGSRSMTQKRRVSRSRAAKTPDTGCSQ
jgi:hypothetical protein